MFSLICVWINGWVNNREAGDLRRYRAHYDVSVMFHYGSHLTCLVKYPRALTPIYAELISVMNISSICNVDHMATSQQIEAHDTF